jgi:hypothetical protein
VSCLCADIAAGRGPRPEDVKRWLDDALERVGDLGSTMPHYADVTQYRCRTCAWTVLHLRIEHEGFSGSLHHYFVPSATAPAPTEDYEAWAAARPGVHMIDGRATAYKRARIGYAGFGGALLE